MNKNRKLILISTYVALAIVLDYIKSFLPFLNMPSGGSINIALIPIVLCSFHLGIKQGMLAGLLWWLITFIIGLNPYYVSFFQYICDYIIPSTIVGLSSLFYKKKNIFEVELGLVIMMLIRFLSLTISGAIFWVDSISYAGIVSSIIYNGSYCLPTLIMLMIIIPAMLKTLRKYML